MKQIVLYLITYACVTTTVAGVVQIEIHKKPGGGNTSPSSTLRPTTSTPGDDDFVELRRKCENSKRKRNVSHSY